MAYGISMLVILDDFWPLDFHIYTLVVHKKKLQKLSEGYSYANTFHKNLHGKLDRELLRTFPVLTIVADIHKNRDFMESLRKYVSRKTMNPLFPNQIMKFQDSKASRLIQAADFFAGTIGKAFDERKTTPQRRALLSRIKERMFLEEYPYDPRSYVYELAHKDDNRYDHHIATLACQRATEFIRENETSDGPLKVAQVKCVKFLLYCLRCADPEAFIPTEKILEHMKTDPSITITKEAIRRQVIAPLRDQGVLITSRSPSPSGYKIPCGQNDVYNFLNHYNSIIMPMLNRVKTFREAIHMATGSKFDILDKPPYCDLKRMVEIIGEPRFGNETSAD